jgi:hypothetical protein
MLYGSGQQCALRSPADYADEPLGNAEKRRRMIQTVECCERQGLDDLLVTAGVAPQPDTLIKARDVGKRHALPGIISWFVMSGHCGLPTGTR